MTRRTFIELPCLGMGLGVRPGAPALAGRLTAAMAVDDATRLLALDRRPPAALRLAVLRHRELARLGCGLPRPDGSLRLLLNEDAKTLAVAGGAVLAHHALESLRRSASGIDWLTLDAALLAARRTARSAVDRAAYAAFLEAVDIRCQIEWHTLDPEEGDIHAWLARIVEWRRNWQAYRDELAARLAAGAQSPLLNVSDPVFRLVQRLRRAEPVHKDALKSVRAGSAYGQCLLAALDRLAEAAV